MAHCCLTQSHSLSFFHRSQWFYWSDRRRTDEALFYFMLWGNEIYLVGLMKQKLIPNWQWNYERCFYNNCGNLMVISVFHYVPTCQSVFADFVRNHMYSDWCHMASQIWVIGSWHSMVYCLTAPSHYLIHWENEKLLYFVGHVLWDSIYHFGSSYFRGFLIWVNIGLTLDLVMAWWHQATSHYQDPIISNNLPWQTLLMFLGFPIVPECVCWCLPKHEPGKNRLTQKSVCLEPGQKNRTQKQGKFISLIWKAVIILYMRPANERGHNNVTWSLIG